MTTFTGSSVSETQYWCHRQLEIDAKFVSRIALLIYGLLTFYFIKKTYFDS